VPLLRHDVEQAAKDKGRTQREGVAVKQATEARLSEESVMTETPNKVFPSPAELHNKLAEYYRSPASKSQRLGQWWCNEYGIQWTELFYADNKTADRMIWEAYGH
jgi:hypothetical protein